MPAAASHILVKTEAEAKALKAELAAGAKFADLAKKHSSCPSARDGGSLGTFNPGQMVPEFDRVVFSDLPVGQCSEPVKTQFGYHLVVVTARTAMASASHILVKTEAQAKDLKAQLAAGAKFADLAKKHSGCPSSSDGGALGTFGPGEMVPEFDAVVFSDIAVGQCSEPVKTEFGWHLVVVTKR
jgi:peptidyl-prolyl cis-trans isomerase C